MQSGIKKIPKTILDGRYTERKTLGTGGFKEKIIFQQLICGLHILHQENICHRDIKAENILISVLPDSSLCIKICDYGFSRNFNDGDLFRTSCGTPNYASP